MALIGHLSGTVGDNIALSGDQSAGHTAAGHGPNNALGKEQRGKKEINQGALRTAQFDLVTIINGNSGPNMLVDQPLLPSAVRCLSSRCVKEAIPENIYNKKKVSFFF